MLPPGGTGTNYAWQRPFKTTLVKKRLGSILKSLGLKKAGLKVYFFFYNSGKDLIAYSRKKRLPGIARRRSKKGVYAIELDSDWIGLGARIVKTLELLLYCDERGLVPVMQYGYREKGNSHPDYFGELFQYKQPPADAANIQFTAVRDLDELGWDYNVKMSLKIARPLFDKYLSFNPEVLAEVDSFVRENFGTDKVLGVHYRGTDKAGEAHLVAKEQLLVFIKDILKERPQLQKVFVSTDDQKILQYLIESDIPVPVIFRQDAVRSDDGDQFHRKKEISKSVVNRDAIVNMLLLSRCSFLLKTASILSDCSVIFNPSLEIKVISFPHSELLTWWPATEIKKQQQSGTQLIIGRP